MMQRPAIRAASKVLLASLPMIGMLGWRQDVRAQSVVSIDNISVPPFGSSPGYLSGRVTGVSPASVRVALLDFVSGLGYFSKPYCNQTTVALNADGTFTVLTTTGVADSSSTLFALVVVPASASVACYSAQPGVPVELQQQALAVDYVDRPNPHQRTIEFANETWLVKSNAVPLGPGPNYFSDSPDSVWVDSTGRLHLRITYRNGQWNCAEIYSRRAMGYGLYQYQIDTSPNLDKNVVAGMFTYADAENVSAEIDLLELGRWGNSNDSNNAQNVVQPFSTPGNLVRFLLPDTGPTVESLVWRPDSLYFRSTNAQGNLIHEWTYGSTPPVPRSARLNFHFNLWLIAPPSDGQEAEVIISHFSYVAGPLQLSPLPPCRVMDTRNANGPLGGPYIARNTSRTIPIPSSPCNVPANAVAYSLNITVVPRTGSLGYLSVWPTGQTRPTVSTLNSLDGSVIANAAIVPAGVNGAIDAYVTDDSELIVDINGYFVPPGAGTLQFYPLSPCRVLDTRNPNGAFGGPAISRGNSRSFPIPSSGCGVPSGASAYSFNVTVAPHGSLGYLTAWPTGQSRPVVSTLNSLDGTVLANAAIVPAGTGGAVSFYGSDDTDVVADINGYFALPGSGLNFYAVTPCRVADTRNATGSLGGPILPPNGSRTFPLTASSCGLPSDAAAYSLNMTVVPQGVLGYLTTWPHGVSQPLASTLNALKGQVVANAALVPAGTMQMVDVYVTGMTQLIIDTNGYFGQ